MLAGLVAAAAAAAAIAIPLSLGSGTTSRPGFQRILDGLVSGPQRVAPGATAYVFGPHGTWVGSAGTANVKSGEAMQPDARLRIQSLSKAWLLAVTLQLAQEGKLSLSDTVAHWLPGLLPYGGEITIAELETDTSGLVDDNTLAQDPAVYLARVKDAKLREELQAIGARLKADPNTPVDPIWLIRFAAWQPLLFTPGLRYSHSNIGWNIAGLIVARAAGQSLPTLYRDRIFRPLGLTHTTYQPQGPVTGSHAEGYQIGADGALIDTTAWTYGKGADGAIVTDAADEATFLRALVDNKLHVRQALLFFYGWTGGKQADCPGDAFSGVGAGAASWAYVYYDRQPAAESPCFCSTAVSRAVPARRMNPRPQPPQPASTATPDGDSPSRQWSRCQQDRTPRVPRPGRPPSAHSGRQALEAPLTAGVVVYQPVVHPVLPSLPELHGPRPNPPTAPVWRHRDMLGVSELPLRVGERGIQRGPAGHHIRLRGRPRTELGTARTGGPIGGRLGRGDLLHWSAHVGLPLHREPRECRRGPPGGQQVTAFGRRVVGEKHHATGVEYLAEHAA